MGGPSDHHGDGEAREAAPRPGNPTVTMTLFAYNQEAYIREAVEGAFSQTYQPLEIILSDDCSTDRTFEIMQEMVADYAGPHRVSLRRNERNLGVIEHYNLVFDMVETEFFVFAAGDDVSLPHRVDVSISKMLGDERATLVHSCAISIDDQGNAVGKSYPPVREGEADIAALATAESIYIGATGTYRTSIWKHFGRIEETETYEDLILGFRSALFDGLRYIDEPLIKYRVGVGVSFAGADQAISQSTRRLVAIKRRISTIRQRQIDLSKADHPQLPRVNAAVQNGLWVYSARYDFYRNQLAFLKGFFSRRAAASLRALAWEVKFSLGLMK